MLIQMDEQILIRMQNVYMWHTIVNTEADTVVISSSFQCKCGCDKTVTEFVFHYVWHKDLSVGLGTEVELKEKVIRWIQHVSEEEKSGFGEVLLCKQMMLQDYVEDFSKADGMVDEITLYVLSRMLREPIAVITKKRFWSMVEGDYIGDMSIVFVFGGDGHFILLQRAEDPAPGNHYDNHIIICTNICFDVLSAQWGKVMICIHIHCVICTYDRIFDSQVQKKM